MEFEPEMDNEEVEVSGGFLASIIDIFTDPSRVFARIEAGLTWWKGYILISIVSIVLQWLMFPFQTRILELNPRGMSEEQLQNAIEATEKFKYVGLVSTPIGIILIFLILAGILHLMVSIMSSKANFKRTLSLVVYAGIISLLGQIVKTAILLSRGVDSIESMADMKVHLSLAAFFPDLEGAKLAFLDSLGVFEIWYYVVLTFGIAYLFKIKKNTAVIPVVVIWVVSFLLMMLSSKFGG